MDGYNVGVKRSTPEKQAEYAVVSNVAGFRVEETTNRVFDKRPSKFMIEIYEFEGCPYCKKVREAISILDLDVIFYPCPKGSTKHRDMVMEMGGKQQFPYMRDPNSGVAMYESDDIIAYLFDTYGPAGSEVPRSLNSGVLTTLSCGLALTPRLGKGSRRRAGGNPPTKPLIYWGYEASPFCKVVREVLNELEIPHIQVREPFLSAPSIVFLRCFFIPSPFAFPPPPRPPPPHTPLWCRPSGPSLVAAANARSCSTRRAFSRCPSSRTPITPTRSSTSLKAPKSSRTWRKRTDDHHHHHHHHHATRAIVVG